MTTKKCSDKCLKSPDKKHCWHNTMPGIACIPCGTKQVNEFCCWCGKNRSYIVELPTSYSVSTIKHGPFYKETYV